MAAFLIVLAPTAGAATPQEICHALQNGGSASSFSLGDLQRYASDPTVQGYCPPVTIVTPSYCTNAAGQPVDQYGNVTDVAHAAPVGNCTVKQQPYCKNAAGQPVDKNGNVTDVAHAAPVGNCTVKQQPYCKNAAGQPVDKNGNVTSVENAAAPDTNGGCAHAVVPASNKPAPPAPMQGVQGAKKTLKPKVVPVMKVQVAKPVATPAPVAKPAPVVHVAPATSTVAQPAPAAAPAPQSGTLPFTGLQLSIFAAIGLALIASGILLRTTTRRGPDRDSSS